MILVLGFYDKGNIGDELFKKAFVNLFPNSSLKFVSTLSEVDVTNSEGVILGGGSFLGGKISGSSKALENLKTKPVFYFGVGVEAHIDPQHLELLSLAKLIVIRNPDGLDKIRKINPSVICLPDIVYSLSGKPETFFQQNKVLIVTNSLVVPKVKDPYWKHASWQYFKSEFSQFLDCLVSDGYHLDFLSMCDNPVNKDFYATIEILNSMTSISKNVGFVDANPDNVIDLFAQYPTIVTQRFHGIVLSQMNNRKTISIAHHDKLHSSYPFNGRSLSYYGLTKNQLLSSFYGDFDNNHIEIDQQPYLDVASLILKEINNK